MLPFLNLWLHVLAAVIWIGGMLFLSLVAVLVALGMTHDFIIGPRAARAQSRDGLPPTGTDLLMVQLAPWVGRLNLLLGVIILVLAAALTRSH